MSFVTEASRTLPVSAEVAFDCLADYDSWAEWMPDSFRPITRSVGQLRPGVKAQVRIMGGPLPASIRVRVADRGRELTWGGGVRGVFLADHRFLFERKGDSSVDVRSVERWSGVVAAVLRRALVPSAERIGREQLEALEKAAVARATRS